MSMNHYVNGNQLDAFVYQYPGSKTPGVQGNNQIAEVTADATSINGATSLDLAGTTYTQHGLMYIGGKNITDTSKDLSRLTRCKFPAFASNCMINTMGSMGNNMSCGIESWVDTAGNIKAYFYNDAGSRGINQYDFTGGLAINTWYDIGWTWNNTTKALKMYKDGVLLDTATSTGSFSANFSSPLIPQLGLGTGSLTQNTEMWVDEDVVWDEIVDFTSGGLNTNGAARSSYLTYTPTVEASGGGVASIGFGKFGF